MAAEGFRTSSEIYALPYTLKDKKNRKQKLLFLVFIEFFLSGITQTSLKLNS